MIISHVENGEKLADENRLPKAIKDIIKQHHGTTLVKYFYMKSAKESEKTGEPVNEKDFRYPGPIPQSKEAAIVMLADTVEAAARSSFSKGSNSDEVRKLIDVLFKDKLDDGQLNDCRLDLKELETIKNSFMKMFNGMYHHRISYPKQEEINATRRAEAIKSRKEEQK
jgi:membrane-associated HD superfamily phosphohydrolase